MPRIVVTVDMIATGTDVRPIEVLIFLRDVKSELYYEQMKGRGVRSINISDLKQVTPVRRRHRRAAMGTSHQSSERSGCPCPRLVALASRVRGQNFMDPIPDRSVHDRLGRPSLPWSSAQPAQRKERSSLLSSGAVFGFVGGIIGPVVQGKPQAGAWR